MKKSVVLCGILTGDSDTKLVKNAENYQFANKAILFANKSPFLRTNAFICE
jgi:hypothetical protein